jgi:hypothetical protein
VTAKLAGVNPVAEVVMPTQLKRT